MYTRRSCFYNHREGRSQFAGIKPVPVKNRVFDSNSMNSAIKLQEAEHRRELIYALASA